MRNGKAVRETHILGCALQQLAKRDGRFAAQLLMTIDLRQKARTRFLTLTKEHQTALHQVMAQLTGTNARRVPGQHREELWTSNRAVVIAALYSYGLECKAQLATLQTVDSLH